MSASKIVRRFLLFIGGRIVWSGLFIMFVGFLLLVYMMVQRSRLRQWPDWSPAALGSIPPHTQLLAVNDFIAWVYQLPMPAVLWAGGILVGGLGVLIEKMVEQPKGQGALRR
jgi:hypothetical protein